MERNYATVHVCSYTDSNNCTLQLEPEISEIFATSTDPEELTYYWLEWYNLAGTPMRQNFIDYVELSNEAARLGSETFSSIYYENVYDNHFYSRLPIIC